MGNCKDCLWWTSPQERKPHADAEYFECTKTMGICELTQKFKDSYTYSDSLALSDADESWVWLLTDPEFGCVQWQGIPDEDAE